MVFVEYELGSQADSVRLGERVLRALGDVFTAARERAGLPGVSFGVASSKGMVCSGHEGWAALEPAISVMPESVFRIASMTKSLTACCVLLLRDAGVLGLDDEVRTYLPELRLLGYPEQVAHSVTLRHLLTMSAGLVEDDPWADRQLDMSDGKFTGLLRSGIPLNRVPGSEFEYSNLGYAMLGRVLEVVSGSTLPEFASRRLFQPLEMGTTHFEVDEVAASRRAIGYRPSGHGNTAEPALPHGAFGAMGGIWTSIADFGKYAQLHLRAWMTDEPEPEPPVSMTTLREMQQPHRAICRGRAVRDGVSGLGYGFGLFSGWHERQGPVVFHSGGLPGYGSHVEWLPDCDLAVFAFANLTYAPMRVAVGEAIEVLDRAGLLVRRLGDPAPELARARDLLVRSYQQGALGDLVELAADNLFRDRDLEERKVELAGLRAQMGPCQRVGALRQSARLRGAFTLHCEAGDLECELWLSPTASAGVQLMSLRSSPFEPG
jgi:CubicO group peptidase (beta-lactamase class C family)